MHRSAFVRWGAAALVAIVTSIVVASDLAELHRRARSLGPERTVVAAAHDLGLGAQIADDDLVTRQVHESQLPEGVATSLDDVRDRVVVVPILEGSFVTPRHLAPNERDGLSGVVPAGSRAIRVEPISAPSLRPGDVVDVLVTFNAAEMLEARLATRTALVLRVDENDETEYGAQPGITLLVRASDAGRVAEAVAAGTVTLALAAPEEATEAA